MSSAPGWVTYVSLLLSAGALVVSVLAYRAGAPRLRLRVEAIRADAANNPFPEGAAYQLTVVNSGRAAITVDRFRITPYGERKPAAKVTKVSGLPLPYRLEAHASQSWVVDALPAARTYDRLIHSGQLRPHSSWPSRFRFSVDAGNGRRATTQKVFDSLRLIADSR